MNVSLLLLPVLLLALSNLQPASCYWFREQISLDPGVLPPGISVSSIDAGDANGMGIRIENHTGELLFVLSLQYLDQLAEPTTPDPLYEARLRYSHEVASYLVPPEGERPLSLGMPALLDLDPALQQRNRLDPERPAPEDLALPEPQDSLLLLVHGETVYRLPFTISYILNPDYDPAACGKQSTASGTPGSTATQSPVEQTPSDGQSSLPGLALLLLVGAALLGASLLIRRARQR